MNKLFTKIAALALGAAMVVGVGVSVGSKSKVSSAEAATDSSDHAFTTDTVTFSTLSLTNQDQYTGDFTNAADINTFKVNFTGGGNDGKYYDTGTGIRTYGGGSVTVTALNSNTLTQVVFTFSGSNYAAPTDNISGYTLSGAVGTWTGSESSITLTRASGSGHWRLQSVKVTVDSGSTTRLDTPTLTKSNDSLTWTSVSNVGSYELTVDGTVAYTGSSLSYNLTTAQKAHGHHTASVVAKPAAADTSHSDSLAASTSWNVFDHAGTEQDPYSVADARLAIDQNVGLANVYATGIVSAIPNPYDSGYSNITFNIVDQKTDTVFLQAFRCTGTEAANVAIDDVVVVSGTLTKYGQTYEFGQGCVLESRITPSGANTITFDSDGGTDPDPITRDNGQTFTFPSAGTKSGYVFTGWTTQGVQTVYAEGTTSPEVQGDITYTAQWQTQGNSSNPYTVAQARAAITSGLGVKDVYVSGTVSEIVEAYSSQYSNITFNIVNSGSTDTIKAYRCTGSDASNVAVGGTVTIHGDLILHNTDYELASGCQITSYSAPVVPSVTITNSDAVMTVGDSDITLAATTENAGGASVVWSSSNTNAATIVDGNKLHAVAAGASTITATITVDNVDYTDTISCTVSNAPIVIDADGIYEKVTDVASLAANDVVLITNSDGTKAISTTQNTNNRAATETNISNDQITISGSTTMQAFLLEVGTKDANTVYSFNTGSGYIYAASSSANHLKTQETLDDNGRFTVSIDSEGVASIVAQGTYTHNVLQFNNTLFACYTSASQGSVSIFKKGSGTVDPTKPVSVTLDKTSATVGVGDDITLEATINPAETAIPSTATWLTSSSAIATVSNGTVHGVAAGEATITAFADENSNGTLDTGEKSATCTVTVAAMSYGFFYQVTDASTLSANDKVVIAAHAGSSVGIMTTTSSSNKMPGVEVASTDRWSDTFGASSVMSLRYNTATTLWTLGGDSSGWTLSNGDEYLYIGGNNTNLITNSEASSFTFASGSYGTFRMASTQSTRAVAYNGSVFGHYATSNIDGSSYYDVEVYKLVESVTSIGSLTCSGTGSYTGDWDTLSTNFSNLSLGEKAYYKHASYSKSGTGLDTVVTATHGTDNTVAQFVAKYDDVVSKYDVTNFIGRSVASNSGKIVLDPLGISDGNPTAIIIIVSVIGVSALGGFFFLRKRKEI